jgi:hypothetical protein
VATHTNQPATITPQLVIGLFVALLGVVLTLDRLDFVQARHIRLFWPLAITAVGVAMLVRRRDSRGRLWGVLWTAVGWWLLLDALNLVHVSPGEMIVPIILVLIGARLVSSTLSGQRERPARPSRPPRPEFHNEPFRAAVPQDDPLTIPAIPTIPTIPPVAPAAGIAQSDVSGRVSLFAVLGEARRASNDNPLRGGEMTAIMGGCILDLRQATIPPGGRAVITVLACMAGHEIWVPASWVVISEVIPVLGASEDKRLPPLEPYAPDAPRLVLKGMVLMGGVEIKN